MGHAQRKHPFFCNQDNSIVFTYLRRGKGEYEGIRHCKLPIKHKLKEHPSNKLEVFTPVGSRVGKCTFRLVAGEFCTETKAAGSLFCPTLLLLARKKHCFLKKAVPVLHFMG